MRHTVPTGKRVAIPTGKRLSVPMVAAAYTPPIDYAVSYAFGLRTLVDGYAGTLIRLRRDSDDAESDFSAVDGIIDTAAIATWLGAANGFVTTWYDQSGNGRDVVHATKANQPKYIASHNGKPALLGDGINDFLRRAGTTVTQPLETLWVWQSATQAVATFFNSTSNPNRCASWLDGGVLWAYGGSVLNNGSDLSDADTHYSSIQFNGASSKIRHDGTEVASGNAGTSSQAGLTLFASEADTLPYDGHMYELIESAGGLLSSGQRSALEANQASFFGVS